MGTRRITVANTLLLTFSESICAFFPFVQLQMAVHSTSLFSASAITMKNREPHSLSSTLQLARGLAMALAVAASAGGRGSPDLHQRHGGRTNCSRRLRPRGYRQQRACAAVPAAGGDRTSRGVCSPFAHLYVCAAGPCQELVQALRALLCLRSTRVFREGAPAPARQIPR